MDKILLPSPEHCKNIPCATIPGNTNPQETSETASAAKMAANDQETSTTTPHYSENPLAFPMEGGCCCGQIR